MVDTTLAKRIKEKIKKGVGEPCSQEELRLIFGDIDRRIISGYLQCMIDLGEICVKDMGKTKAYFVKESVSNSVDISKLILDDEESKKEIGILLEGVEEE